jgi:hypothetical protein
MLIEIFVFLLYTVKFNNSGYFIFVYCPLMNGECFLYKFGSAKIQAALAGR